VRNPRLTADGLLKAQHRLIVAFHPLSVDAKHGIALTALLRRADKAADLLCIPEAVTTPCIKTHADTAEGQY
jgi:hypothetical protein